MSQNKFYDQMDKLQQEVEDFENDHFEILYKKLGRLPTCKELDDHESSHLTLFGFDNYSFESSYYDTGFLISCDSRSIDIHE